MKSVYIILTVICIISCSKMENQESNPKPSIIANANVATQVMAFYTLKSYKLLPNKCAIDPTSVVLDNAPLVTLNDILSYSETNFTYTLSVSSFKKIQNLKDSTPIAVSVNGKVIFISIYKPFTSSSTCYHSITMQAFLNNQISFQLGYPTTQNGLAINDQRNNLQIIEVLRGANKMAKFSCINNAVGKDLLISTVKSKIFGEWKLDEVISDRVSPSIPQIRIVLQDVLGAPIDKQLAYVYLDCKLIYTSLFTIKQINGTPKTVRIDADKKDYKAGEPAVLSGSIRICDGELMIDTGMAFDAPAYLFSKVKTASCLLKPDAGMCMAAFERYYYDPIEKKCKPFIWGGCGGVVPFETLESCRACECNK